MRLFGIFLSLFLCSTSLLKASCFFEDTKDSHKKLVFRFEHLARYPIAKAEGVLIENTYHSKLDPKAASEITFNTRVREVNLSKKEVRECSVRPYKRLFPFIVTNEYAHIFPPRSKTTDLYLRGESLIVEIKELTYIDFIIDKYSRGRVRISSQSLISSEDGLVAETDSQVKYISESFDFVLLIRLIGTGWPKDFSKQQKK